MELALGNSLYLIKRLLQSLAPAEGEWSTFVVSGRVDKKPDASHLQCFSRVSLTFPKNLFLNGDLHQSRLMDYPYSIKQLGRTKPGSTSSFFSTGKC